MESQTEKSEKEAMDMKLLRTIIGKQRW